MSKMFYYELYRLMFSRLYLGLLLVTLWYSWQTLGTVTILGVAHTAPFSPWSFGAFLAGVMPVLSVALLLFIWNQRGTGARGVEALTRATSMSPRSGMLVRCGVVAVAWLSLALASAALGTLFLAVLFGSAVPFSALMAPAITVMAPALALVLGVGFIAGGIHPALLLVLMAVGLAPVDFYGMALFTSYPLTLQTLDPAFSLPPGALWGRILCTLAGVLLLGIAVWREGKK